MSTRDYRPLLFRGRTAVSADRRDQIAASEGYTAYTADICVETASFVLFTVRCRLIRCAVIDILCCPRCIWYRVLGVGFTSVFG
jgi:hypothetical protein